MRYLSLFSGIEAVTVAWHPLGWQPVAFAEVEPFPCAVLAHHYPGVPNLGDVTAITAERIAALGPIDLVVGGSPCQDLSVAGKRGGLAGARSGLFHEQMRIFHAARTLCGARWLVWENVPGAFSANRGIDFALVVGTLAGCGIHVPKDGWGTEGVAVGALGLVEWAVLDAQWHGLAQRRRRVFAVLDTGAWANRAPVLLERDSLRGDHPPRRQTGQDLAPCLSARTGGGGGLGTDFDLDGGPIAGALRATDGGADFSHAEAGQLIAGTVSAKWAKGSGRPAGDECQNLVVAHTLRGDGFDASEDGTGRGTPLVPVYAIQEGATRVNPASGPDGVGVQADIAYTIEARHHVQAVCTPLVFDTTQITSAGNHSNPRPGDPCHTLAAGAQAPAIAVHGTQDPDVLVEQAHTPGRNHGQENAVVHAFQPRIARNGRGDIGAVVNALAAQSGETGKGDAAPCVAVSDAEQDWAVRRLTPRECERLMGFPDDYTLIPWRGKSAELCPDGPRYRALGNSMAVPVMRWIGRQIARAKEYAEWKDAA